LPEDTQMNLTPATVLVWAALTHRPPTIEVVGGSLTAGITEAMTAATDMAD